MESSEIWGILDILIEIVVLWSWNQIFKFHLTGILLITKRSLKRFQYLSYFQFQVCWVVDSNNFSFNNLQFFTQLIFFEYLWTNFYDFLVILVVYMNVFVNSSIFELNLKVKGVWCWFWTDSDSKFIESDVIKKHITVSFAKSMLKWFN